jgi:hypothetical protein
MVALPLVIVNKKTNFTESAKKLYKNRNKFKIEEKKNSLFKKNCFPFPNKMGSIVPVQRKTITETRDWPSCHHMTTSCSPRKDPFKIHSQISTEKWDVLLA